MSKTKLPKQRYLIIETLSHGRSDVIMYDDTIPNIEGFIDLEHVKDYIRERSLEDPDYYEGATYTVAAFIPGQHIEVKVNKTSTIELLTKDNYD